MSRSSRRQKSEEQLRILEHQFVVSLNNAVRECATGKWGMFGHNDAVIDSQPDVLRPALKSGIAEHLIESGDEIVRLRQDLKLLEPLWHYDRYLQYRHMRSANSVGEPKLASQFLAELDTIQPIEPENG